MALRIIEGDCHLKMLPSEKQLSHPKRGISQSRFGVKGQRGIVRALRKPQKLFGKFMSPP